MDRFRGRVIVPIFDADGRNVIAFGGRHLENPIQSSNKNATSSNSSFKAAKYLNSPESLVFKKKKTLFGFHQALNQLRERRVMNEMSDEEDMDAILHGKGTSVPTFTIVEGYFDALALDDVGVPYVTACMGTALTKEQIELIAKIPEVRGKG